MCGLAGLVLNPKYDLARTERDVLDLALLDLMERSQRRGAHATGVAVLNEEGVSIVKRAQPAREFVKLGVVWKMLDQGHQKRNAIIMGHTRHATHKNAHLDHAAHPFRADRVVGAHNGIITNYQEVEMRVHVDRVKGKRKLFSTFEVDSEAAFAALDTYKKPAEALALLRGYFALTWIRGGSFFVARTPDAPLTMVYLPQYRAMIYASERETVLAVLDTWKIDYLPANVYDPTPGQIYRYVPSQFSAAGTGVEKIGEWKIIDRAPRGFDSRNPTGTGGGVQHQRRASWTSDDADRHWARRANSLPNAVTPFSTGTSLVPERSMRERLSDLEKEVVRLRGMVARLDRALVDQRIEEAVAESERTPTQADLDLQLFAEGGTCASCGFGATPSRALFVHQDELLHAACFTAMDSYDALSWG